MGFLIGIIIFFVVIWIIVKAFSSNEKEVQVTQINKETGEEITEIRTEVSGSAGKTAAQVTLMICIGIPILILIIGLSL